MDRANVIITEGTQEIIYNFHVLNRFLTDIYVWKLSTRVPSGYETQRKTFFSHQMYSRWNHQNDCTHVLLYMLTNHTFYEKNNCSQRVRMIRFLFIDTQQVACSEKSVSFFTMRESRRKKRAKTDVRFAHNPHRYIIIISTELYSLGLVSSENSQSREKLLVFFVNNDLSSIILWYLTV